MNKDIELELKSIEANLVILAWDSQVEGLPKTITGHIDDALDSVREAKQLMKDEPDEQR